MTMAQESYQKLSASTKRRNRRHKLKSILSQTQNNLANNLDNISHPDNITKDSNKNFIVNNNILGDVQDSLLKNKIEEDIKMSSTDNKSRDEVMAARQAKKLAKQKGKGKESVQNETKEQTTTKPVAPKAEQAPSVEKNVTKEEQKPVKEPTSKGKDEVDRAVKIDPIIETTDRSKEDIKAERAAKKAAKQAKKKGAIEGEKEEVKVPEKPAAKEAEESNKSKAELKAERRAKQEAQRAAKQAAQEKAAAAAKPKVEAKAEGDAAKAKEEKTQKQKTLEKPKVKSGHRVNWFQHLYKEHDKEALKSIAINSNLHPAIVKLGVQLASKVVSGSNARCVALLDALKKMVRDYTLPAKTEFARGLESHLATSLDFLWAMRSPSASQTNAIKFFRYHLTQLPNNVDEFDAKKTLQEEIDRYIKEQIDMAGEAISITVRNKIADGDNILTYGCSSLIERILRDAWSAGLKFRTVVVGNRVQTSATQMLRRLVAHGLPCTYIDITSLSSVMDKVNKVVLGASALLVNGSVLGAAGTAQVALGARAYNVPVLVACETHKFSERVQTDAFVYNEIGDPDDLIDKSDENSPLKDWRSNPNLTPLNLTYDVTPPSLVTAVVTELAILPCTSAPVVLRFKLSEYGV
ncbi:translation initiation factor eIF-2B subunit delta isoform X3 [Spodoptera frugiperda]|uniref:Translation initiation factor eIF2B subunit delta n=1 Tax=Spodoptera frugiperda TaxID=7108 RepID=A0A9R0DXW4_SPOFR|nr:translation initiation factor eIF-2B subunit delta isoform X3 [Spodoptera frugiperda]